MRMFFITMIYACSLLSMDFSTRYDVDVGMFGKVGYADVTLSESDGKYEIRLVATTAGTAATLTAKRSDTFISKGRIIEGVYLPDTFVKIKKTTRNERIQTYSFDHINQKITLVQEESKWVSRSRFDPGSFKLLKEDVQELSTENSELESYNPNDLLSSYLNAKQSCNSGQKEYILSAVGAHNEKKDITLSFLDGLKKEKAAINFSDGSENIYSLHVQPIDKEEKAVDVLIAFDNDGHMQEALLGDVFWIGEIKAKRVYHQVTRR